MFDCQTDKPLSFAGLTGAFPPKKHVPSFCILQVFMIVLQLLFFSTTFRQHPSRMCQAPRSCERILGCAGHLKDPGGPSPQQKSHCWNEELNQNGFPMPLPRFTASFIRDRMDGE